MAKKKTRSPANGEQQLIPEMVPKRIEAIHRAAKRYAQRRDERIEANKEEKAAHEFLLNTMRENLEPGQNSYCYGDLTVFIDSAIKCKVKIGGEAPAADDGEAEE